MQLYYIRHAQSVNNALWTQTGSNIGRQMDPALSELGRKQAEILAEFVARTSAERSPDWSDFQNRTGFHFTHLYTSLFIRAIETGMRISKATGLPLLAWEEIHESGGIFLEDEETGDLIGKPGPNRAYFETNYPDLVLPESLNDGGWWNRPFETYEERAMRARRVLDELLKRHGGTDDRVVFISHGGFYNYLLGAILSRPKSDDIWFLMNNAGISRIDFEDERFMIVYQNRVDFLPEDLIT